MFFDSQGFYKFDKVYNYYISLTTDLYVEIGVTFIATRTIEMKTIISLISIELLKLRLIALNKCVIGALYILNNLNMIHFSFLIVLSNIKL